MQDIKISDGCAKLFSMAIGDDGSCHGAEHLLTGYRRITQRMFIDTIHHSFSLRMKRLMSRIVGTTAVLDMRLF